MNSFLHNLRWSVRLLLKYPGFSATVIAVLALGVGANTAIFSVIYGVLLDPFPYKQPRSIVMVQSTPENGQGGMSMTYPDFNDIQAQVKNLSGMAYISTQNYTLTQVNEPASIRGVGVSSTVWSLLGTPPLLGRVYTANEDKPGADPVCVISYGLWQGKFAGDPQILGRSLLLSGKPYTVIGVMPQRFKFSAAEIWTPVGLLADTDIMRSRVLRTDSWVVGRLADGKSLKETITELNVIAKRLSEQYPDSNKGIGANALFLTDAVTGPIRGQLLILAGAVGFVLLIACANVANLLLSRAAMRHREFAIRTSLGAERGQLISQVLTEVLPLAVLGTIAGILAGAWGLRGLLALMPSDVIPAEAEIGVNGVVMVFSLLVCVVTMFLFALLPAFEATRTGVAGAMQESGRGGSSGPRAAKARAALIVAEVGLSLILLVGAGLLMQSFARLQAVNPGFKTSNLLVMGIELPQTRYRTGPQATQFFRNVVDRLAQRPGVTSAAASNNAPFLSGWSLPLLTSGKTYTDLNQLQDVQFSLVTEDYFAAQGLKFTRGHGFTTADRAGTEPVIVLNEAAVKRFLDGKDPLREQVMLGLPANLITPGLLPPALNHFQWARVVGVVESARHFGLQSEPAPAAFIPVDQGWDDPLLRNQMFVLIRTSGDPLLVATDARATVKSLDADQPVRSLATMESTISDSLRQSRFGTVLLGLFAAVASLLAVVGVYGVISWNVTQRMRELGIRAALGATQRDLVRLVVGDGMKIVLLGVVVGLAGSFALSRVLSHLLFETSAFDPVTFAAVSLALCLVALLACLLPALRASKANPLDAIRTE